MRGVAGWPAGRARRSGRAPGFDTTGVAAHEIRREVGDDMFAAEPVERTSPALAAQSRFLDAALSSIPDFVYAFDPQRRFAYANPAMLGLFGLSADEMLGKTFADLDYPADLADRLNGHIDQVLKDGVTVEDEVFYRSPTGRAAHFAYLWGPVRAADGTVELVVGVSRDTSERHAFEEALRRSEARLRAATEVAGLGVYSWGPATGGMEWDDRLRAMWGLAPGADVDEAVFEAGIHPDDRPRVRLAIAACRDPHGDGLCDIEFRVIGREDGVTRHIATAGRTEFVEGRAVGFIGAAIDVTRIRRSEAAVRASEALFRGFADNSSALIWIADPASDRMVFRSAAYERIWGVACSDAPAAISQWMSDVHPDDRRQVEHALESVKAGEVARFEYRIVRPSDGAIRLLRETSFPIPVEEGAPTRIGGITEDLTQEDARQVYIVCGRAAEARRLAGMARAEGYHARTFTSGSAFLDIAPVLSAGCVLVDLRKPAHDAVAVLRELKARSVPLPACAIDAPGSGVERAVAAMKAGAVDYVVLAEGPSQRSLLAQAISGCLSVAKPISRDGNAGARVTALTSREREVLVGLVDGGTNKSIANKLGISPRTVELHRAHVMDRLNASNLAELLQVALSAGVTSSSSGATKGKS